MKVHGQSIHVFCALNHEESSFFISFADQSSDGGSVTSQVIQAWVLVCVCEWCPPLPCLHVYFHDVPGERGHASRVGRFVASVLVKEAPASVQCVSRGSEFGWLVLREGRHRLEGLDM